MTGVQQSLPPMGLESIGSPALADLRGAIDDSHLKHGALAASAHISDGYLSRELSGQQACPVTLIDALPAETRVRFAERLTVRALTDMGQMAAASVVLQAALRVFMASAHMR